MKCSARSATSSFPGKERLFGWNSLGGQMDSACRWLITGGERPVWVRVA
jgi:hypothetical protein